jgi:hypothetical protein
MVTKEMYSKFSTYLVGQNLQHSVTKKAIVKNGTMIQYISGVFNVIRKKYPHLSVWREDEVVMNQMGDLEVLQHISVLQLQ